MDQLTIKSIHPLAGFVLIEPQEVAEKTTSGIFLADTQEEKDSIGTVVAASESVMTEHGKEIRCPVKVGDRVLYKKWSGYEVNADDKKFQILTYEDLIAVVQ